MRGSIKAAALLSVSRAATFVIPDLSTMPANPVIEYQAPNALVKFDINSISATEQYPTFTFQVEGTSKPCGESHILLNGLKLDSEWDGTTAHGRDFLDVYGGKEAEWHITCLFDAVPADGSNSKGEDVVHVLSLRIGSSVDTTGPGFTISYRQMDRPAIIRLKPRYYSSVPTNRPSFANRWRTPSLNFDPEVIENAHKNLSPTSFGSVDWKQKSLGTYLQALKGSLKKGVQEIFEHFCPKHKAQFQKAKTTRPIKFPPDEVLKQPPQSHDELMSSTDAPDSTSTIPNLPAAETRSLKTLEYPEISTTSISTASFPPPSDHNLRLLKLFALVLILGSCLAWICLRCRDPRRHAERLARREERRNKKLYRRAARYHKVKMWFWNFRLKYGLAPREVLNWDEKRTRVLQQEEILENVMKDDIRTLRNAQRVVSIISAAEEGRNTFTYDAEGSERRRSISTLPGYESEGSQPPTYDDIGSLEGASVANGFRYNPVETEFRSDSSVISTSPRISRDGTSSDLDEKFEPISLESTGSAG